MIHTVLLLLGWFVALAVVGGCLFVGAIVVGLTILDRVLTRSAWWWHR